MAESNVRNALIVVCSILLTACSSSTSRLPSDGMVMLPGAEREQIGSAYDGTLEYVLEQSYPGERAIRDIRSVLTSRGWRLRQADFVNGSPFSVTARWRDVQDNDEIISVWYEQWENTAGDVVQYRYTYHRPTRTGQPGGPLNISITSFRSETVRAIEREGKQQGQ